MGGGGLNTVVAVKPHPDYVEVIADDGETVLFTRAEYDQLVEVVGIPTGVSFDAIRALPKEVKIG